MSKVVRPCERRRNSRVWWSSNGEWQTNTCEFCSGIFQGYRNEAFQWVDGRRSHRTSHVSNVSQWAAFICYVTKCRQITKNPVPRRRPCQHRKLVDVIMVIRGINVENSIQNKAYGILINRYPLPVAMSTKQASFNVLTDKDRSVRPWRSRFNLVSQCLTTFQMWWSGFPPLHGNISWGPISSFLESAQILWSHVAYQQYHGSSYKVMSRTPKYHSMSSLPKTVLSALNLVSQSLTTFHMWWYGFPPLHGNISWGPVSWRRT